MAGEAEAASLVGSGISNQMNMGIGGMQAAYGLAQWLKGNKDLKNLEANRPQRTTDSNFLYNQQLAQAYGGQGYGNEYLNLAAQQNNRFTGAGLGAILANGGDINQVGRLLDQSANSYRNFLMGDIAARNQNRQNVVNANSVVAQENIKNNAWNTFKPYVDNVQRATQQTNSGVQNFFGGLGTVSSAFGNSGNQLGTTNFGGANTPSGTSQFNWQTPSPYGDYPSLDNLNNFNTYG